MTDLDIDMEMPQRTTLRQTSVKPHRPWSAVVVRLSCQSSDPGVICPDTSQTPSSPGQGDAGATDDPPYPIVAKQVLQAKWLVG